MLSLPVELQLQTIHHIRDSIPSTLFEDSAYHTIVAIKEYNKVLAALALYHREWTAIAQSELFRNLYIRDAEKMKSLLDLLHGSEESRGNIKHSRSAVLGGKLYWRLPRGRRDDLDELADYCPDLAEMSCYKMDLFKLEECQRFQKLRKLNLSSSDILSAPTSPHRNTSALSITTLSLTGICIPHSPLDPAYLPFLRSLTVPLSRNYVPLTTISPVLSQLTSLILLNKDPDTISQCVTLSTSLKILSLRLHAIGNLNSDTQAIIRDRIEELRIVIDYNPGSDQHIALSAIISGSRVMKKVTVDGSKSSDYGDSVSHTMNILVPVCKKAEVQLWKENFEVGNGKVDLDSR